MGANGKAAAEAAESRSGPAYSRTFRLAVPHEPDRGRSPYDKRVKAGIEAVILTGAEMGSDLCTRDGYVVVQVDFLRTPAPEG